MGIVESNAYEAYARTVKRFSSALRFSSRLHNIAGKYTGKDDPVMLVRVQKDFPATGEVPARYAIGPYVAGAMRGSHQMPLMPVPLNSGISYYGKFHLVISPVSNPPRRKISAVRFLDRNNRVLAAEVVWHVRVRLPIILPPLSIQQVTKLVFPIPLQSDRESKASVFESPHGCGRLVPIIEIPNKMHALWRTESGLGKRKSDLADRLCFEVLLS